MTSSTIAFDIEVAGFPWEEVDEITREYLLSREGGGIEAVPYGVGLCQALAWMVSGRTVDHHVASL